jgi:hypothetical protein
MRLKITLHHAENVLLPWDYQYAVQSWIYHTLSQADEELTTRLHDIGFPYEKKRFKLFGFGQWVSLPYLKKGENGMLLQSGNSEIQVSFLLPELLSTFISGLFKDSLYTFYFPNKNSIATEVIGVEILPTPDFSQNNITYQLTFTGTDGYSSLLWTITQGDIITTFTEPSFVFTVIKNSTFTVEVVAQYAGDCARAKSENVVVSNFAELDLISGEIDACPFEPFALLKSSNPSLTYVWQPLEGLNLSDPLNPKEEKMSSETGCRIPD